jgi:hypothetical protein
VFRLADLELYTSVKNIWLMPVSTETTRFWTRDKIAVLASLTTMIGVSFTLYLFVEYPWEPPNPFRLDMLLGLITGYIFLKIILITEDTSTESEVGQYY